MKTLQNFSLFAMLFLFIGTLSVNAQTASSNAQATPKFSTIKIKTSAECDMCKTRLEKEIGLMKGVKSATLDLATKELTVEYNPKKVNPDKLRTSISNLGYDADDVKANNRAVKELPQCCQPKTGDAH